MSLTPAKRRPLWHPHSRRLAGAAADPVAFGQMKFEPQMGTERRVAFSASIRVELPFQQTITAPQSRH